MITEKTVSRLRHEAAKAAAACTAARAPYDDAREESKRLVALSLRVDVAAALGEAIRREGEIADRIARTQALFDLAAARLMLAETAIRSQRAELGDDEAVTRLAEDFDRVREAEARVLEFVPPASGVRRAA